MKNVKNDLIGRRFGRLVVVGIDDRGVRRTYYFCQCDCGNTKSVRSDGLLSGAVQSCGCMKREQDRENLTANHKHKMSHTRPYEIWQGMKKRCYNPHDARYDRYGGRGITVCDECGTKEALEDVGFIPKKPLSDWVSRVCNRCNR